MRKLFSFLAGATVGALVGATISVLMAPQSGDELRGEIRSRANRFSAELKEAAQERRAELEHQLEMMRRPQAEISLE
jgi:gas vesicle protein